MVKKEFPCDNGICNNIISAISPDDSYTHFSSERCCEKSKEKKFECDNCNFINTRFWCVKHVSHAGGPMKEERVDRFSTYV